MLATRLIVCLDVRDRKTTKGVRFKGNIDLGDPVEMGEKYYRDGVDELVFYDITASAEGRPIAWAKSARTTPRRWSSCGPSGG